MKRSHLRNRKMDSWNTTTNGTEAHQTQFYAFTSEVAIPSETSPFRRTAPYLRVTWFRRSRPPTTLLENRAATTSHNFQVRKECNRLSTWMLKIGVPSSTVDREITRDRQIERNRCRGAAVHRMFYETRRIWRIGWKKTRRRMQTASR